jgi:tetratricopeptide (TPR) repeat protein
MGTPRGVWLRLCAIPHGFNISILMALAPELGVDRAEEECLALSKLSIIKTIPKNPVFLPEKTPHVFDPQEDSLVIHSDARRYLFNDWLRKPNLGQFELASARMVDYYDERISYESRVSSAENEDLRIAGKRSLRDPVSRRTGTKEIEHESLWDQRIKAELMFHQLGADQGKGFVKFEKLFGQRRREHRLNDCEHLLKLVHEYDSLLTADCRSRLLYHEAKLALDRRQLISAKSIFHRVLQAVPSHSIDLQVKTWIHLGRIEAEKQNWVEAIVYYDNALSMIDWMDNPGLRRSFTYDIFRDLGVAYRDSGNLEQAEQFLQKSINYAEEVRSLESLAIGYNSLGTLYRKLGDSERAVSKYEKSLSVLNQLNDEFRPAQVYNNIGLTYLDQRLWNRSVSSFQKSLEIKRQAGDTIGQAKTLNNLMQAYSNLGKKQEAIETAEHAAKLFEEVEDYYDAALVVRNLARLYRRTKGRIGRVAANRYYEEALKLIKRSVEDRQFERSIGLMLEKQFVGRKGVLPQESRLLSEVQSIREEINSLNRRFWLPWWMWISIIALLLIVIWFFAPLVPRIFGHPSPF